MVEFVWIIKLKMDNILSKTSVPIFQYPIIPCMRQAFGPQNILYFNFICVRDSN
jgi:hypothetical protein